MSSFLVLVQDLHREVGAAGVQPSTVTSQAGEALRLVNWIISADTLIQDLWTDWKFLWAASGNLATAAASNTVTNPSSLNFWDFETFRIDNDPIEVVEYHEIRREILDTTQDKPSRVIIMPDNTIKLEPVADAIYQISADYWKQPTVLAANADISAIPATYHKAILGRAMILYANFEGAPEIRTQGEEFYIEQLDRLENHELPNKEHARFKQGGHFEVVAS